MIDFRTKKKTDLIKPDLGGRHVLALDYFEDMLCLGFEDGGIEAWELKFEYEEKEIKGPQEKKSDGGIIFKKSPRGIIFVSFKTYFFCHVFKIWNINYNH